MNTPLRSWLTIGIISLSLGCSTTHSLNHRGAIQEDFIENLRGTGDGAGTIETVWLQINDVYEMLPLEGGRAGGLARVAKLEQKLIAKNPNTRMVIAGDFLSPSAIGAAEFEGRKLNGRQMLDTLAEAGLDIAVFGNHEFDIPEEDFRLRLQETKHRFKWVSGNVLDSKTGAPFEGTSPYAVLEFTDQDGDRVRIGILNVTIDSSRKPYVRYLDRLQSARNTMKALKKEKADIILALTHQSVDEDRELIRDVPGIDLLLGGHEHVAMDVKALEKKTLKEVRITKADANAKTAWIHALTWDTRTRKLSIKSVLQEIGDQTPEDPRISEIATQWIKRANEGYRAKGFEPTSKVILLRSPLDGREEVIRSRSTSLSEMILGALQNQAPQADVALFNSGLVRVDDVVQPGVLTEYDILRIAPFPDEVLTATMNGADLIKIRDYNRGAKGDGMYLQIRAKQPLESLDPAKTYSVVMNTYLAGRIRGGLAFSKDGKTPPQQDPLQNAAPGTEFRKAIIHYLRSNPSL